MATSHLSELEIQQKIQAVIQDLSLFADADVVINDWSIFDRPNVEAPYVLILNSDEFESFHRVETPETRWLIPVILVEAFSDWKTTFDDFRERRQQIITTFNGGEDERGGVGLDIERIIPDAPITEFYDAAIDPALQAVSMPSFIMQRLLFETSLF